MRDEGEFFTSVLKGETSTRGTWRVQRPCGERGVVMHLGNLEKANVAQAGDRRGERRERRLEVRAGAALSPAAGVVFVCFCLFKGRFYF